VLESRQQLPRRPALAQRQVDEAQVAYAQGTASTSRRRSICAFCSPWPRTEQVKTATAQVRRRRRIIRRWKRSSVTRGIQPDQRRDFDRPLYAGRWPALALRFSR